MSGLILSRFINNKKKVIFCTLIVPLELIITLFIFRYIPFVTAYTYLIALVVYNTQSLFCHLNRSSNICYLCMPINRKQLVMANLIFTTMLLGVDFILILLISAVEYNELLFAIIISFFPFSYSCGLILSSSKYSNDFERMESIGDVMFCLCLFIITFMIYHNNSTYLVVWYAIIVPLSIIYHIKHSVRVLKDNDY